MASAHHTSCVLGFGFEFTAVCDGVASDADVAAVQVEFGLPDLAGRTHIFRIHAKTMSVDSDIRWGSGTIAAAAIKRVTVVCVCVSVCLRVLCVRTRATDGSCARDCARPRLGRKSGRFARRQGCSRFGRCAAVLHCRLRVDECACCSGARVFPRRTSWTPSTRWSRATDSSRRRRSTWCTTSRRCLPCSVRVACICAKPLPLLVKAEPVR